MKSYTVAHADTLFGIAQREYGDGGLFPVIARQNHVTNPDLITVGQHLLVPYVTYRHLLTTDDSTTTRTQITQRYYGTEDPATQLIWEVANGVAQRRIQRGCWLLIPDLADVGHHTVVDRENFLSLARRWYGDDALAVVIAHANHVDLFTDPPPGSVLVVPRLNRRRCVAGDTLESLVREEYGADDVATKVAVVAAANYISRPHALFSNQVIYFPS
ncbi:peptidoglycan-binding protein LysM [Mycobacterium sp. SWH-M5]|nr:peptidoglycan-binding protein LysM [Mycobacterium sp. SWH-M5]